MIKKLNSCIDNAGTATKDVDDAKVKKVRTQEVFDLLEGRVAKANERATEFWKLVAHPIYHGMVLDSRISILHCNVSSGKQNVPF